MTVVHPLHRFIRPSVTSTTNCPGCGNGIVAQAILRAIDELALTMDDFVYVSGIGCSAWIPSPFFNADVLHTTHGRPIAFALGIKMGLPDKKVMVVSGDGDLAAIGGNHLIHNARRNVEMIVVCLNNGIYGMTGGQAAPTTPMGLKTTTTPYGSFENALRYFPAGDRRRGLVCGPVDDPSRQTADRLPQKGHAEEKVSPSSRS